MPHLACRVVTIPALDKEIVCCSIASWIDVRSASFIYWKGAELTVGFGAELGAGLGAELR